ncbi:uncharacterized protein HMPREF1541_00222 [Cyphellophora europaea CBS 101466]|uniref:Uncharacterized protein n=1 Tax=Cyphellophora europaea (strain CBS 101466) TaxID=1220924 RepID=W2SDR6_CYPE1|nr:uncharacterized protein HMPREF1541_00222 [Cyphellophora europaea CBS 101466]ETN46039.1 hypothetical protein HMPREF1541_00222 [Cyphellophora europaea CBS 101466]
MYKSLSLLLLAALGATATNQPWEATSAPSPPPPPPAPAPPAPPAPESWKDTPAPPPPVQYVHATFQGANPPEAQYTRSIPADGSEFYTNDPLSISHIVTDGGPCTFYGVDGLVLAKPAGGLVDVGPPQTITKAVCKAAGGYKAKRFSA